jgi:hypothetical protein
MSLAHLKAMRGYKPKQLRDQLATAFLWILAQSASRGAKYKSGHQSEFGYANFLSDNEFMARLGIGRQGSLRRLRNRFRKLAVIQTERKRTGKSIWADVRDGIDFSTLDLIGYLSAVLRNIEADDESRQ